MAASAAARGYEDVDSEDLPTLVRLHMALENIEDESNFPLDFQRRKSHAEDWTYEKARPQLLGEPGEQVCSVWYAGHGCRDWLACKNGTHPRFVWKGGYRDTVRGMAVTVPAGWHDLLNMSFCRKNLRSPSTRLKPSDRCCRDDMDENDVRSGCHRLHQCTPYSRGSFLHEDGHWYMPYSWMRFYDWFYREAYDRGTDDKFYWEPRPDNSTVKDARLSPSMDPPQPMSAEDFETRKALLESKRTRRPAAPAAPAPRPAERTRAPSRRRAVRLDTDVQDVDRVRRAATPAPNRRVTWLDEPTEQYTERQLDHTRYGIPGLGLNDMALSVVSDIFLDLNRINLDDRYNPRNRAADPWAKSLEDVARSTLAKYVTFFNSDLPEGNIKDGVVMVRAYLHEIRARQERQDFSLPEVDAEVKRDQ